MKEVKIRRISYSPGYCDMRGEYHSSSLRQGADGSWTMSCSDRETHDSPTVTAVYSVSAEKAEEFGRFINENKVISLEDRPKSDLFATDYSPWGWGIDYDKTSFGKTVRDYCRFGEYKRYSARDYELLNELEKRFYALRGEIISETVEQRDL